MRLFIAEKPSLGRAIATVLPRPHKKEDGYIVAANGDTVSWCVGHLLEQQEPEAYDPAYKQWSHEHLPIVPEHWKLKIKAKTAKQVGILRKLFKQAEILVHAGDPDREGQLLVDELIHFIDTKKSKPVLRCLVNDLNPAAVSKAVNSLRNNNEFIPLSTSALARSRADWLFGINLTRAYTLQGKAAGYKGVLSVGRVQTPILGLVVKRDQAIDAFVSQPFYEVWANLKTENDDEFQAKWQPSESCQRFLDEQGRNLSQPLADNVAKRISHQLALVKNVKRELKKQSAPLPYSLSALQIDAGKAFGMSAKQVLDVCQNLYENHKAITYPRSDCRYLPTEHHVEAPSVYSAIQSSLPNLNGKDLSKINFLFTQKTRVWNDKQVSAHHAIIPTKKTVTRLNNEESKIYGLVARNYLAQFLPQHEFAATTVHIDIAGGQFKTTAKEILVEGWQQVFPKRKPSSDEPAILPKLEKGQHLQSLQASIKEKHTSPPAHFTDATLLAAMTGIASHVKDSNIRKILKDTDGLGTEATRANIIELLFTRGFLQRNGKTITATPAGRVFINALPERLTLPDMTAQWEATLADIAQGKQRYETLMTPLTEALWHMTIESRSIIPTGLNGLGSVKTFRKKKRFKAAGFKKP
ncbi:DNA topoisomerase III [Reinekea sp.]|jgi:DNA topoisomerase-3|uniref:DNA topoisomerase III n=1 Tax=Reinekea sp. TaxID=1970455 RepID=UPI00398998D5